MTPQLQDPGHPAPNAPPSTPAAKAISHATRTRSRVGAAALIAAGLAASACAATTTQSTAGGSVTTRARGPIELAINADVAALGKVVGDFAPEQTTTTKPAGPGEPGGTESTIPGETVPTTPPTVAPTLPPVTPAPTRPPPVVTTQTFRSDPTPGPTKPKPSPFTGSLSADEQTVFNLMQGRAGPLTLDGGLMQAARGTSSNAPLPDPPNAAGTFSTWKTGKAFGNLGLEGVFNDGANKNNIPTDAGYGHVGISVIFESGNYYIIVLLAKV